MWLFTHEKRKYRVSEMLQKSLEDRITNYSVLVAEANTILGMIR